MHGRVEREVLVISLLDLKILFAVTSHYLAVKGRHYLASTRFYQLHYEHGRPQHRVNSHSCYHRGVCHYPTLVAVSSGRKTCR